MSPGFSGFPNMLKAFRALRVLFIGKIGMLEHEFLCRVSKCKQTIYSFAFSGGFCLQ